MENLENNQEAKPRMEYNTPVHPTVNVPPPSGLTERMASPSHKPKNKITLIISVVVLLVILGVGGWWYYAQGQVWFMLKQAKWDWGEGSLENYQQNTTMSLEVRNRNNGSQEVYAMLFGTEKFNIDIVNNQKNVGANAQSDIDISASTTGFNLKLGLETIKIDNKMYLKLDLAGLEDLLMSITGSMSDSLIDNFQNSWFEMDIEESYNISLDKDKMAQINVEFNNFLQELKSKKVFDFKDLKENDQGYRRIQLNVKEEKIDDVILSLADYSSKFYDIILEEGEFSDMYKQSNEERIEEFKKMKTEKPEDWEKLMKVFRSVDFVILINPKTKNIHGWELNLNNLELESGSSSTVFNGNVHYFIDSMDYYEINKPDNVKSIENFGDIFMEAASMEQEDSMMMEVNDDWGYPDLENISEDEWGYPDFSGADGPIKLGLDTDGDGLGDSWESFFGTDINNPDSDGDGYLDGEEVDNGYNPAGEGLVDFDSLYEQYMLELDPQDVCEATEGQWQNGACQCPGQVIFNQTTGCLII